MELQLINPLVAQLTHRPFPEVADALRTVADQITRAWDTAVREAMPQMRHLTYDQLKDSTPEILIAIADALASADPRVIEELVQRAPRQGLSRLELNFDVIEIMQEDRLLRAITVIHVEAELGRRMDELESAALHSAVDLMLQRSVIALVDKQKVQLRAAAETELKFLSFLSHDMNNNLGSVKMRLEMLRLDLRESGKFPQAEESLDISQRSIDDTVEGMKQMLNHERLRKSGEQAVCLPVDLHATVAMVVKQFAQKAKAKQLTLSVDVKPGMLIQSYPELLNLVLQNLVGNAVKYSASGIIRIGAYDENNTDHPGRCMVWVSDQGPGIARDKLTLIFEAFNRGEVHGQHGVGLGLAIASQAAKLMAADLTVISKPGDGSTFRLLLPDRRDQGEEYRGLPAN